MAAPRALGARRVRPGHLFLAVLMITIGGVLATVAFYSVANTSEYLAVARKVPAGTELSNADLRVVQLNTDAGVAAVPAGERARVVGQRTTVSLLPGQLLVREALTAEKILQAGQRQIAAQLDVGRVPADTLRAGDRVQAVETPDAKTLSSAAKTDQASAGKLGEWDATVVGAERQTDDTVVVYLAVADADAAQVGTLAAAGRLILVLAGAR